MARGNRSGVHGLIVLQFFVVVLHEQREEYARMYPGTP